MPFRLTLLAAALGGVVAGCSCNPIVPPPPADVGPRVDTHFDAGPVDANLPDTNSDAPGDDSGDEDAGGGPVVCTFDAARDVFDLQTDTIMARARPVSIGSGPNGWGVAFSAASVDAFQEIWFIDFASTAIGPSVTQLTMDLHTANDPAVAWDGANWTLAWWGNRDGNFEVYGLGHAADGHFAMPQRLTNDAIREDAVALGPLASGGTRIAWVQQAMDIDGTRTAFTGRLAAAGTLVGTPTPVVATGLTPSTPRIVERVGGFGLVWADRGGNAVLVPLDDAGAADGAPIVLNTAGDCDGTVDVTLDPSGGAAVFGALIAGIRREVHVRPLDETGRPSADEQVLTIGTETGRDASITSLAGGYAVAYRALDVGMIRVLLLDLTLGEVMRLDLASAEPMGGPVMIRASGDGQLLVGWTDQVGAMARMRAARIRCE